MNMHMPFAADRTLLPRGLIKRPRRHYTASYAFKLGQLVVFGGTTWVVTSRQLTPMGKRLYSIFRPGDERPKRVVLEAALAAFV